MSKKILLVDGNSIANRAFYALPPLSNGDGFHTNAVYGFFNMLFRFIDEEKPEYLAAAFDLPDKTFRAEKFADYKSNRRETPSEFLEQLPVLKDILRKMNINVLESPGYEADDIIGTLAKTFEEKGFEVVALSGDRDLLQLASEKVKIKIPKTVKGKTTVEDYYAADVAEKIGVTPKEYIEMKGLMGDSSDNYPGVPGIGEKTALKIIQEFKTVENAILNCEKVSPKKASQNLNVYRDQALLSRELAAIITNVPLDGDAENYRLKNIYTKEALKVFNYLEIKNFAKRFDGAPETIYENAPKFKDLVAFTADEQKVVYCQEENKLIISENLDKDFFESDIKKICLDSKREKVFLAKKGIDLKNAVFDASLANYLTSDRSELRLETAFGSYEKTLEILKNNGLYDLYFNIELPFADVLKDMELYGVKIDRAALLDYRSALDKKVKAQTEIIYGLAGEEFNINSPQQTAAILFEKLGLPGGKRTKTGYSTNKDVLEKLSDHKIVREISEYRTLAKLKSGFADSLLDAVKDDDKIYSTFNQTAVSTGRISSSEPNLQNIPIRMEIGRELRKIFIPSEKKYIFLDADYSQIELRVLAAISGDPTMTAAFENGEDIHRRTASEVMGVSYSDVTREMRSAAKAVNFGIVYGIGAFSLARDINVSVREAERYIESYFAKYPLIKKYLDRSVDDAIKSGYAKTMFNRRRPIPELFSKNYNEREFGRRAAMNMPIQGTAADIIKIAMIKIREKLKNYDARLILQVHDEILVEADRSAAEEVKEILKTEMENAADLPVKLEADVSIGENWYEAK